MITWHCHPWVSQKTTDVRVGVQFLSFSNQSWSSLSDAAHLLEDMGFDSLWIPDHPTKTRDCWVQLSALAVTTRSLSLGSLVSCVGYRPPALLARMATDVHHFSNRRLVLGLGIGDLKDEFHQLGIPFVPTAQRQDQLEDTLHQLQQQPFWAARDRPPLLIAGGGKRTLKQVAQYADMANFGTLTLTGGVREREQVAEKCHLLHTYCQELHRPMNTLLISHITIPLLLGETRAALDAKYQALSPFFQAIFQSGIVAMTPDEACVYYQQLLSVGVQYIILAIADKETLSLFHRFVLPSLKALAANKKGGGKDEAWSH